MEEYGKAIRPFLINSKIISRSCSTPLERRIVDFSADAPFHQVADKLKEHYGFTLSSDIIRKITMNHAAKVSLFLETTKVTDDRTKAEYLIAEADGGMVPIVEIKENPLVKDKRKTKKLLWKEARLCFARDTTKATAIFRATLNSVDALGDMWFSSALEAGMGNSTKIHCLGDGALWIKDQVDRIFGNYGSYLVDFYHVSEYLGEASTYCNTEDPIEWFKKQQTNLKKGDLYLVLQELEKHINQENPTEVKDSVLKAYRYLTNRLHQLDYLGAITNNLPIGSGEIESGHRHVVQKRMKRAGAWWKETNAEHMLQLLTLLRGA